MRAIGDDINGKRRSAADPLPQIEFPRSRLIHFARFAILNDPDRGAGRKRLLYASVYDGTLDAHLDELTSITRDMDAIWEACEGYAGVKTFASYIRAHAYEPAAYYAAFRDETAASVSEAIAQRRRREALQDSDARSSAGPTAPSLVPDSTNATGGLAVIRRALEKVGRAAPLVSDLVRALARFGFANLYFGTRRLIASLDRYPIFRFANWLTRNRMPPLPSPYSSVPLDDTAALALLVPGDEIPVDAGEVRPGFREDAVAQNQLTVVTVVPPAALERLGAVMAAIDSYARRLAPPGSLIGISTIHFVRWLFIDQGRRLMLVSDYDGSWESYIDEFAEMIVSGLDAIWGTAVGAPPAGARDVPAFKHFLRTHQVPADVFFSAYPNETVLNIVTDVAARRVMRADSRRP